MLSSAISFLAGQTWQALCASNAVPIIPILLASGAYGWRRQRSFVRNQMDSGIPVLRPCSACKRSKQLRSFGVLLLLAVANQVWDFTAAYAHMRICLEIAACKTLGLAQVYDEMVRKDWCERAKRGECCIPACCCAHYHAMQVTWTLMSTSSAFAATTTSWRELSTNWQHSRQEGAKVMCLWARNCSRACKSVAPGQSKGAGGQTQRFQKNGHQHQANHNNGGRKKKQRTRIAPQRRVILPLFVLACQASASLSRRTSTKAAKAKGKAHLLLGTRTWLPRRSRKEMCLQWMTRSTNSGQPSEDEGLRLPTSMLEGQISLALACRHDAT